MHEGNIEHIDDYVIILHKMSYYTNPDHDNSYEHAMNTAFEFQASDKTPEKYCPVSSSDDPNKYIEEIYVVPIQRMSAEKYFAEDPEDKHIFLKEEGSWLEPIYLRGNNPEKTDLGLVIPVIAKNTALYGLLGVSRTTTKFRTAKSGIDVPMNENIRYTFGRSSECDFSEEYPRSISRQQVTVSFDGHRVKLIDGTPVKGSLYGTNVSVPTYYYEGEASSLIWKRPNETDAASDTY